MVGHAVAQQTTDNIFTQTCVIYRRQRLPASQCMCTLNIARQQYRHHDLRSLQLGVVIGMHRRNTYRGSQ